MGWRHSFVLHLCPLPNLDAMLALYQGNLCHIRDNDDNDPDDDHGGGGGGASTTATSWAVSAHAWLNARLTNAFSSLSCCRDNGSGGDNDGGDEIGRRPGRLPPPSLPTSIVHLQLDVWRRLGLIGKLLLRGNCGMHCRRHYARRTVVGGTTCGAQPGQILHTAYSQWTGRRNGGTSSWSRRSGRSDCPFGSFELMLFCTAKDATVVGGLTKLISVFVRDVAGRGEGDGSDMDVVTSIDGDFGHGNSWPNFASVEVMEPVPMFVGEVDGARWHTVGADMTPLRQSQ